MTTEKKFVCKHCGKTFSGYDLTYWRHTLIDGGSYFMVCPYCADTAMIVGKADDYDTAIRLGESLEELKE